MQTQPASLLVFVLVLIASVVNSHGAPWLREILHSPASPRPGEQVKVTATAAPGITNLSLEYQLVDPGRYVELSSPSFRKNWNLVPMARVPTAEPTSAPGRFSVDIPGDLQVHRRLVRYRFRGAGADGSEFLIPGTNDARPNFAYFVYAGIPAWAGAIQPRGSDPKSKTPVTFAPQALERVQSYHLIARNEAVENATWKEQIYDSEYRYTGTLVVDGVVYDHLRFRARGGGWRYAMGKNMWKFDLPKGQPLVARDDYGERYPGTWGKVNLRACIQQGDYGARGEQGMFEAVGFRLFQLASVAAPRTHWIQLRIVSEAAETPKDQYRGDFWGLYLAIEQVDDHFLSRHGLPPGNVFRMEGGGGTLSSGAKGGPTDGSDLRRFLGEYHQPNLPDAWWRSHLDLPSYYSYRSICECIHHYDIGDGKNYYYYHDLASRRWSVIPWDIDLTWGDHMYGSGAEPFKSRVLGRPAFRREYQNRLREIRDLLFNPGETDRLIDECAAIIADPAGGPSPAAADRAKWDYHPVMAMGGKAGQGLFYEAAPTRDFPGMVRLMKQYVRHRASWIDRALLAEARIPETPKLTYVGGPGFSTGALRFQSTPYAGPGGFAGRRWRIAEIAPPPTRNGRPTSPGKYEITALWDSGELTRDDLTVDIPAGVVAVGHRYRVRVRTSDTAGNTSHWSPPLEFVAGNP